MTKKLIFLFILGILALLSSCSDDEEPMMNMTDNCDSVNVSYQRDIVPIINSSCALTGCHVSGFNSGDFTNYADIKQRADNGRLNTRVVVNQNMPPSNSPGPQSLSDAEIEAFECWIAAGAPEN